jgi:hypothetical protein
MQASTDVVVIGKAYAPRGAATGAHDGGRAGRGAEEDPGRHRQSPLQLSRGAAPVFTDPEPFTEMEIRYDRAYGAATKSVPDIPFLYPRNFMGPASCCAM